MPLLILYGSLYIDYYISIHIMTVAHPKTLGTRKRCQWHRLV